LPLNRVDLHQRREINNVTVIKSVSVTVGRTVNVGNFNSIRADVTLTADLDGTADEVIASEIADLRDRAMEELSLSINNLT
jgi:hypothetical protein